MIVKSQAVIAATMIAAAASAPRALGDGANKPDQGPSPAPALSTGHPFGSLWESVSLPKYTAPIGRVDVPTLSAPSNTSHPRAAQSAENVVTRATTQAWKALNDGRIDPAALLTVFIGLALEVAADFSLFWRTRLPENYKRVINENPKRRESLIITAHVATERDNGISATDKIMSATRVEFSGHNKVFGPLCLSLGLAELVGSSNIPLMAIAVFPGAAISSYQLFRMLLATSPSAVQEFARKANEAKI